MNLGNRKIHIYKQLGLISCFFVLSLFVFVNNSSAAEITPGTGFVIYGDGTEVSTGTLTTTGTAGAAIGALSSISQGTINPFWSVAKTSPTRKEALVGNLDGAGKLEMLRWNGTAWSLEWTENSVGSTSLDTRAYHIAYETSSSSAGEAVVAWAKAKGKTGGAAGFQDDALEYKVWNGTSWTASTSFDLSLTRASISWMEMWSHPASGSNQSDITLCYATGRSIAVTGTFQINDTAISCLIWDGATNTWGNQKLIELDSAEIGPQGDTHSFSGFYEQGSGDFIAVAATDLTPTAGAVFATWTTSWSATSSWTPADPPDYLDCSSMPWQTGVTNNQAVCAGFDDSLDDPGGSDWTGSGFGTGNGHDNASLATSVAGRLVMASGWLVNGTSQIIGPNFYGEAAAGAIACDRWNEVAGNWTTACDSSGVSTPAGTQTNFAFDTNPYEKNKGVLLLVDSNSDLFIYKASISGSATPAWGAVKLSVTKDLATATNMPAAFSYFNYASPTFTHFKWYEDDGVPGSATQISAEDIKASGSEALTIDTNYRLRTQISNEGPASISTDKFRLEFTKANTSCVNGGVSPGWGWRTVPVTAVTASDAFNIEDSSSFTDGDAISSGDSGITDGDPTFVNGAAYDAVATSSATWLLNGNSYTELEWNIKPNSNAQVNASYCFRLGLVNDENSTPDTLGSMSYTKIASASVQAAAVPTSTYTQNDWEWFNNADSIDPGSSIDGDENMHALIADSSVNVRLRMNLTIGTDNLLTSIQRFKLQYSSGSNGPWVDVDGASAKWDFNNNAGVANSTTLATPLLNSTDILQTYNESNPTNLNPNSATIGQNIEYDWSLDPGNITAGRVYYFRMVKSNGDVLENYNSDSLPSIRIEVKVNKSGGGDSSSNPTGQGDSGGGNPNSGGGQGNGGGNGDSSSNPTGQGDSGGGTPDTGGGEDGGGGASPVIFDWLWIEGWIF